MNEKQETLRDFILAGLNTPTVRGRANGSVKEVRYIFNNMIAKYSSSLDVWSISSKARIAMKDNGVDLTKPYPRNQFSNKPWMCEHPVPATVVLDRLLELRLEERNSVEVTKILDLVGPPCVLLKDEDKELRNMGLKESMPVDWEWGPNVHARYDKAKIEVSTEPFRVEGGRVRR
jgi:hypothetical protein